MSTEDNKEQRHKSKATEGKEQVDARIAAARSEGLLLVITGNGRVNQHLVGTITRAVGVVRNVRSLSL